MQAVIFEQPGAAENVLVVRDVPSPTPGKSEVLIKVTTRTIQPADFLFISNSYRVKPVFPQVAGFEGVGTITATGPGVTNFNPGMRVAFRSPGAWAELAVAPISRVYPVPVGVPDAVASQFSLNPLTAYGLLAECEVPEHGHILITAGRSIVASITAKLAQHRELRVTLLVRDGDGYSAIEAEKGGIISSGSSIAATLQEVVGYGRFNAVLDAVGGAATLDLINVLQPRGRLISYGVLDDSSITLKASTLLFKNMYWQGFGLDGWLNNTKPQQLNNAEQELWELLSQEPGLLPVLGSFNLDEVQKAIRASRETRRPGKVLLVG
jgi:NADPH:quinone reductase-like Zn-dependent oxidoreductase